jgi:hypothetical protein
VSGAPSFLCFSARYARPDENSSSASLEQVSKSEEKSSPNADSSATDDVGWKPVGLRTAIVSVGGRIGIRRPPPV